MNFFERQAEARRLSKRLMLAFGITVLATVVAVNLALGLVVGLLLPTVRFDAPLIEIIDSYPRYFFWTNTLVTLLFIVGGAWLESHRLRGGGAAVARMLDARPLPADPADSRERRLRNVAEEMSIAAGAPLPRLYVLDNEPSINAMAAGFETRDFAVIVSKGALLRLNRDELQGVFAHELAHVLHGDAALNMRLAAYVSGILIIHQFGRSLVGTVPDRLTRRDQSAAGGLSLGVAAIGWVLVAVGAIGWLAARWLQASISRQREYLADATAVRFTRLPNGIGNALRKVMHLSAQGDQSLIHLNAARFSAAWMVEDAARHRWFASHPPIGERIRRIFGRSQPALVAPEHEPMPDAGPSTAMQVAPDLPPLEFVAGQARIGSGDMTPEGFLAAAQCVPPPRSQATTAWLTQWRAARDRAHRLPDARRLAMAVLHPGGELDGLEPAARQAVLEIACATLRGQPRDERLGVIEQARQAVIADRQVTMLEYAFYLVLRDRLGDPSPAGQPLARDKASPALATLIRALVSWPATPDVATVISYVEAIDHAQQAWPSGLESDVDMLTGETVERAIAALRRLGPLDLALAIKALALAAGQDGHISIERGALIRALCAVWSVPVPPLLAFRTPAGEATRPDLVAA